MPTGSDRGHGLQLWVNLKSKDKMVAPAYQVRVDESTPSESRLSDANALQSVVGGAVHGSFLLGNGRRYTAGATRMWSLPVPMGMFRRHKFRVWSDIAQVIVASQLSEIGASSRRSSSGT